MSDGPDVPARSGESSEAGGAPSSTAKASRARVSVTVLFIILGVLDATWASRIPLIRERLHLSDLGLSLALAGPAVGLVVSTRLATAIVDRIGNKRAARRAAVASAAFSVLPGIAPDLVLLAISLAVWGACLGTLDITMNAQGSALERTEGRSLMSRLHASYSMAILAFAAVGALAARLNVAPPVHFLLIGGVCVVLVVLCTRALPDDPDPGPAAPSPASAQARRSLIGYPRLMALAAIGFCALLTEGAVINWSGVFMRQSQHASLALAPLALAAFSGGMVIGRLSGDALITRSGHLAVVWRSAAVAAAGMALAAGAPSVAWSIAGYAILGLGLAPLVPIVFALGARSPGLPSVWALSRLSTAAYAGQFLGPPAVGVISAAVSLRGALLCVAALLVAVTVAGRLFAVHGRRAVSA